MVVGKGVVGGGGVGVVVGKRSKGLVVVGKGRNSRVCIR